MRVEGRNRDFGLRSSGLPGDQLEDALLHFARGLVGEGDAEDAAGGDPAIDHVGDAKSNHPGLAGSGAGENQDGAANRLDGLSLLRVERTEIEHRARSLGSVRVKASGLGAGARSGRVRN